MAEALAREASEGLGMQRNELAIGRLLDVSLSRFKTSHGMRIPLVLVTYVCSLRHPTRRFRLTGEHAAYEWASAAVAAKRLAAKFGPEMAKRLSTTSLGGIR